MDHISKHLNNAVQSTTMTYPGSQEPTVEQQAASGMLINNLFKELTAIFPAWKQAYSSTTTLGEVKNQWMKGLMEAGLSDWGTIQGGLAACRSSGAAFLPSVGEFTASCKHAVCAKLGALDPMVAYGKLQGYYARPQSHREPGDLNPFIYQTISENFDSFSFQRMPDREAKAYFLARYADALAGVAAGDPLKRPIDKTMRINNPSGCTHSAGHVSKEQGRAHIEAMRKALRGEA